MSLPHTEAIRALEAFAKTTPVKTINADFDLGFYAGLRAAIEILTKLDDKAAGEIAKEEE